MVSLFIPGVVRSVGSIRFIPFKVASPSLGFNEIRLSAQGIPNQWGGADGDKTIQRFHPLLFKLDRITFNRTDRPDRFLGSDPKNEGESQLGSIPGTKHSARMGFRSIYIVERALYGTLLHAFLSSGLPPFHYSHYLDLTITY